MMRMTDDCEIPLRGGRITQGVVRKGDCVLRPVCKNGTFVHDALIWLERNGVRSAPRFLGVDERGREILSFLPGETPDNIGFFTDEQCLQAVHIISRHHDAFSGYPGCPRGLTVCHNDLSPCNFVFSQGKPYAVIDWDSAGFGDPMDDLAYAAWMWLDIGNDELDPADTARRLRLLLDGYGADKTKRRGFAARMHAQMKRVAEGSYPTKKQARDTRDWALSCSQWLKDHGELGNGEGAYGIIAPT